MATATPNREAAARYDGNRGYFRRPDGLRRVRRWLCALAAAGVVGWLGFEVARPSRAAAYHTHGEVAGPHAPWADDCAACHRGHAPAEFLADPVSALRVRGRWRDLTCEKCHAGPAHHSNVADGGAFHDRCSNCHHDHNGRDHSLVRLSDRHCIGCHADLRTAGGHPSHDYATTTTDFATNHPEFRPLATPPARGLKFSHALHMTPGLRYTADEKRPFTVGRAKAEFPDAAARYGAGQPDDALVTLNCSSCHQPDGGQGGGAYYQPVNFDLHCKACHPLREPALGFEVPHRKQPDQLREVLAGEHARRLAEGRPGALDVPVGPGGRLDLRVAEVARTLRDDADRRARDGLSLLLQGLSRPGAAADPVPSGFACGKCHYAGESAGLREDVSIAPIPDRSIWFTHAKFDHRPHRGMTCAACHPGTDGAFAPGGRVNEREPALILGAESCRACHAPTTYTAKLPGGDVPALGVRHGCTDCHRYHGGDHPRGRGR